MNRFHHWLPLVLVASGLTACGSGNGNGAGAAPDAEPPAAITNRIDIPAAVRRNLGITFVKVTPRNVQSTRRVPGSFELLPEAHRAYHAAFASQVELLVEQYQAVKQGDLLFRLDSPAWREMQQSLANTVIAIRRANTQLDSVSRRSKAVTDRAERLQDQQKIWSDRLRELEQLALAGAGNKSARTEARAELASVQSALAEIVESMTALESEEEALEAELAGHRESTPLLYAEALGTDPVPNRAAPQKDLALARAASLLRLPVQALRENVGTPEDPTPRWRAIDYIEVVARQAGVVESLDVANGAWLDVGDVVMHTIDPRLVRFRGSGLQADLGVMCDGLSAAILPPGGQAAEAADTLRGSLTIGLEADPLTRTIDLVVVPEGTDRPSWARAGVSTEMEVVLQCMSEPQLAIPRAAVIQDGLDRIIFRRDPDDPDKVIRLSADLGASDGRWVIVESGLMEGDEVVHHGVYELMLASGSAKQSGGHFHADGTWHAEDH